MDPDVQESDQRMLEALLVDDDRKPLEDTSIRLKTVDGAMPSIEPSSAMDIRPSRCSSRRIASSISSILTVVAVSWL